METFDAVVVGGGPAGATAAEELARRGRRVLLLDRAGRVKPCGGAVPRQLLAEFDVPESLLVARATEARVVSPKQRYVDIPVGDGFLGMVDRDAFDEWLRTRAAAAGAERQTGTFVRLERESDGTSVVRFVAGAKRSGGEEVVRSRVVVGADGALSQVARQAVPGADRARRVFAYHEIVESPTDDSAGFSAARCDLYYHSALSPDFYAWIFPHGSTTSVGVGTARKGFGMRDAVAQLRRSAGLDGARTIRSEGAPIPLELLARWDNGRDVVLAGDAAGVVAPASGEGIYYAMTGGRLAAEAVELALASGDGRALATARQRFLRRHGRVFRAMRALQRFWYANDVCREWLVAVCRDRDVQRLTVDAYVSKRGVPATPLAQLWTLAKAVVRPGGAARR